MNISTKEWNNYIKKLSAINQKAAELIETYVAQNGLDNVDALIDYANKVVLKYGNASATMNALMYDAIAELEGMTLPAAELAPLPEYGDVAKAVQGTLKTSKNVPEIAGAVSRLVKLTGQDTMLRNGIRDRAQFAWIPSGDTCAFCITLASRGWQNISEKALKNGHAEHIHSNCDCAYMVRHDSSTNVKGYDPDKYREMYDNAEGNTSKEKINSMRRRFYVENKSIVGAESDKAEEFLVNFEKRHYLDSKEGGLLIKADGTQKEFGGIENHVVGDKSILDEMEGGIFTHNHPLDVAFSSPDIGNGIVKGNLKELRAITSNGNLHILQNENASLENRRKFNALYAEAQKKFNRIANEKFRRNEIASVEQYVEQRKEKWLEENAPNYGLKYTKRHID